MIGAAALFGVRRLASEDGVQPVVRHPGSVQHPPTLDVGIGGDHDHRIDGRVAAGLVQQGDVEHRQPDPTRLSGSEGFQPAGQNQGVDDGFEPGEGRRIASEGFGQPGPVHGAVDHDPGKGLTDRADGGSAGRIEGVHRLVRIPVQGSGLGGLTCNTLAVPLYDPKRSKLENKIGARSSSFYDDVSESLSRGDEPTRLAATPTPSRQRKVVATESSGASSGAASGDGETKQAGGAGESEEKSEQQ